jgi:hypothetical protein
MADNAKQTTGEKYNFSSSAITPQDYQTVQAEKEEFEKKQLAANNEFMFQHYARILRAMDVTAEKVAKAKVILDKKERRVRAKQKRDSFKTARER